LPRRGAAAVEGRGPGGGGTRTRAAPAANERAAGEVGEVRESKDK